MKPFYVTTAILYANAEPHVGHTFELIGADVVARAKRLLGYDVYFQTGTDEHGQKMHDCAEKAGMEPKAYTDEVVPKHIALWESLDISFDRFIRTTDADHAVAVAKFWQRCLEAGDIYKDKYEGWYCVPEENFVLESQVVGAGDNKACPDCGSALVWKSEESYFFKWSRYQKQVEDYLESHPRFIMPTFRKNEMVNSFLVNGLQDISISRNTLKWGLPVPNDPEHVVYVWFDALINYITGVGFESDGARFEQWWPADLHIVGKDILKFHTLLWPAMCFSAGIDPPERIFGHGFVGMKPVEPVDTGTEIVVSNQDKMSKSRGTVVDPKDVLEVFQGSPDPLRFYLLREMDFGGDGQYSEAGLIARYNGDMADKLGNLVSRTLSMIEKYQDGLVRRPDAIDPADQEVADVVTALLVQEAGKTVYESLIDDCKFNILLERIFGGYQKLNLYITEQRPFTVAKDPAQSKRLNAILYTVAEGLRILSILTGPFLPRSSAAIYKQLGFDSQINDQSFDAQTKWGAPESMQTLRGDNLYPKVETQGA